MVTSYQYLRRYTSLFDELGVKGGRLLCIAMSQPDYLIVRFPFIAEILKRICRCIMDIYYLSSNEAHPFRFSFPLQSPSSDQEDPHQYARSTHHDYSSTLAERRSSMAVSQLILSRKRSIRSLVSEHLPNAQASDARPSSPSRQSKRTRDAVTPVSPLPQHLRSHENADYAPTPLLQSSEPVRACATERQASFKYQTEPASLKTLSSPIKFKGNLESFATNPDRDWMNHSALGNQSNHLYCPPTISSDEAQQFSCVHDSDLYRRLSHGEPSTSLDLGVFRKARTPHDLRRKASLHVKDHNCLSSHHQNPEAIQAKPWDSECSQAKPSLWLSLAEEEEIEEMVSLRSLPNQRAVLGCNAEICEASNHSIQQPF